VRRPFLAALIPLVLAAGCATEHRVVVRSPAPPASRSSSPSPAPTKTIVKNTRVLPAGRTATLSAQAGVSLRLTVSRPSSSRTRLSPSYGYPPAHGYYLTFHVRIVNVGQQSVDIMPQNFVVRIPGEGRVTSYDGNSPYSGASRQLNSTQLDPGQRVSAPLTFDVAHLHGRIAFIPDKSAAISWRF
jgi:hypothetical protein